MSDVNVDNIKGVGIRLACGNEVYYASTTDLDEESLLDGEMDHFDDFINAIFTNAPEVYKTEEFKSKTSLNFKN